MILKKKIYKSFAFIVLICFSISSLFQSCETKENKNLKIDSNEESNLTSKISPAELDINKAIAEAYKVWYVKKGNTPDFSKYKDYYTSTAVFQKYTKDSIIVSLISDGVIKFKEAFEAGYLKSFDEREIGSETTQFGNIAHRTSYHIYHTNSNDSITARGVNSIQLVKINGRWKVQSILKQIESDKYQLPEKYESFK